MGTVYLLHFERPIAPGRHTCQHYIGYCSHLARRMHQHTTGAGARLTQIALERNIPFVIARTWSGTRAFERKLKARKEGPRLCPICQAARKTSAIQPDDLL